MKAKVIKEFPGLADGTTVVRTFAEGEIISGELANVAVREKWAEEVSDKQAAKADATEDLHKKTVAELKEIAESRKIDLGDATKKDDIIAAIELAGEAKA